MDGCGAREGLPLLPPYLIGQSKGPPVNGHRPLCLKVLVDLYSLFRVDVLPLHRIPGGRSDSNVHLTKCTHSPFAAMPNKVSLACRTWVCTLRSGSLQGQRARTCVRSPGSRGNSQCLRQRRSGGLDPKRTSCSTKTEQEEEFVLYQNKRPRTGPDGPPSRDKSGTLLSSSAVRLLQC